MDYRFFMTFGDFDPDDGFASDGEPDVEQLAARLHEIRSAILVLAGHDALPPFYLYAHRQDEIDAAGIIRPILVLGVTALALAERIHTARAAVADPSLDDWPDLSPDAVALAVDIAGHILDWLIRQGALR
jgi:hypothetical protein